LPIVASKVASPDRSSSGRVKTVRLSRFLLASVLAIATLILYQPVVHYQFLSYDDNDYVTENIHVRSGLNWRGLRWAFTSFDACNWHPLTWISHMVDYQLFGLNAGGHHYVNVLLHAINAVLLFLLLERATHARWRSFIVAALFALHPLNVETVAWVAERKSLLSAFFSFLTIAAYGWYASARSVPKYMAVAGLFALALMSKPMAVTLPALLLLADYWPLGRFSFDHRTLPGESPSRTGFAKQSLLLVLEKIPLFLMSAISSYITIIAQKSGGSVATGMALALRLENAAVSYSWYAQKAIWPSGLAVFYPLPNSLGWPRVAAAIVFLIGISALAVRFRRKRYIAVGWFAFLVALLPVIGIVQVGRQAMADRYAYIPLIGLFILVVWGVAELSEALAIAPALRAAAAACVLVAMVCATSQDLPYWQNGLKLFTRAEQIAVVPNCDIEDNVGRALESAGRDEEALQHYRAAQASNDHDYVAHYDIGSYLLRHGKAEDAILEFQLALRDAPGQQAIKVILNATGLAYSTLGNYSEAERAYDAALRYDPLYYISLMGRGELFYRQGKYRQAAEDYARASAVEPNPLVYLWWGEALEADGQAPAALSAYCEALHLAPDLEEAKARINSLRGKR